VLALLVALGLALGWRWYQRREHSQDAPILAAARHYGVEPALVKAVVWRESWFDPRAKGRKCEIGLIQLRKVTAQEWAAAERRPAAETDLRLDPAANTLAGAWYLKKLLNRYGRADDPLPYALADYNAGRSNVLRWTKRMASTNSAAFVRQIEFPGTRKYVRSVRQRRTHYQQQLFGAD
jgi:soluble lytic murein transglycosylase